MDGRSRSAKGTAAGFLWNETEKQEKGEGEGEKLLHWTSAVELFLFRSCGRRRSTRRSKKNELRS